MPCPVVSDELLQSFEPLLIRPLDRRGHDRLLGSSKGVVSTHNYCNVFRALSQAHTAHHGLKSRARKLIPRH